MPTFKIEGQTYKLPDNIPDEQLQETLLTLTEQVKQEKAAELFGKVSPTGGTTEALLKQPLADLQNIPEGDVMGALTSIGNVMGRIPAAAMAELPKLVTDLGAKALDALPFVDVEDPDHKALTAAEIGLAGGATNLERGALQMLPQEWTPQDVKDFNETVRIAKSDKDVGNIASVAEFAGLFLDPMGLGVNKLNIARGISNPVARTAANTAVQGAVWGGLGFQEEPGHRLESAALGALGGAAGGAIMGKISNKVASKSVQKLAQKEVLRRVLIGERPEEALQNVLKKYPNDLLKQGNFKLRVPANAKRAAELADDLYLDTSKLKSWVNAPTGSVRQSVARALYPYESHLKDFSPELYRSHRRSLALGKLFEADLWEAHRPLDKWLAKSAKKLSSKQQNELHRAYLEGKLGEFADKYNLPSLKKAWERSRQAFDNEYAVMKSLGHEFGYVENYAPRMIKDRKGFTKELQKMVAKRTGQDVAEIIAKEEGKLKRELTDDELHNLAMRLWTNTKSTQGRSFAKERVFSTIPKPLVKYYASPRASMHAHFKDVAEDFTDRMFLNQLGVKFKGDKATLKPNLVEKALSASIKGKTPAEAAQMAEKMTQYYANKNKAMSPKLRAFKNMIYGMLLANPRSASTQLKDIGFSLHRYGIVNTAKQILPFVKKAGIDIGDDLALHDVIGEEFANIAAGRKALDYVMRKSGFTPIDRLGKKVAVNAATEHWAKLAKKNPEEFVGKWKWYFGDEVADVLQEMRAWKPGMKPTSHMKEIALNELLDIQPLGMAQMPLGYINNPNGRVWYTLNTFTIRQADYVRNRIWKLFQAGKTKEGTKELVRYLTAMAAIGVPVEMLKDFMVFKEDTPSFGARVAEAMADSLILGARAIENPSSAFDASKRIPNLVDIFLGPLQDTYKIGPWGLLQMFPFIGPWAREHVKELKKEQAEENAGESDE